MKSFLFYLFLIGIITAKTPTALAQEEEQGSNSVNIGNNEVQVQTSTQNQGEDSQVQVQVETQEGVDNVDEAQIEVKVNSTTTTAGDETIGIEISDSESLPKIAQEIKSQAQEMVSQMESLQAFVAEAKELSSQHQEKIQQAVEAQVQAQEKIETKLDEVEKRQGFVRTLLGPDYRAMKELREQKEGLENRIEELNQIKTEISNEAETTQIQSAIETMETVQTEITAKLKAEEEAKSFFGWLFKRISGYIKFF